MRAFSGVLEERARDAPDELALFADQGSLTRRELVAEVRSAAAALAELGVRPGDRVVLSLHKTLDQIVTLLAILHLRGIVVPLHPVYLDAQLAEVANAAGATFVLVEPARVAPLQPLGPWRVTAGRGSGREGSPSLPDLRRTGAGNGEPWRGTGEDPAALLFVAAEGEWPRGVLLSQADLLARARRTTHLLGLSPGDRVSGVLCFNFAHGLELLAAALAGGVPLYVHLSVFPNDFFTFVARHRLTVLPAMPITLARLFDPRLSRATAPVPLDGVRLVSLRGGPLAGELLTGLAGWFPAARVQLVYGQTETGPLASLEIAAETPWQAGSPSREMGPARPVPEITLAVVDPLGGGAVDPGTHGEIGCRGRLPTRGLWTGSSSPPEPLPTAADGATVRTGDRGWVTADGTAWVDGRGDGTIKSHGHRVGSRRLERELALHPSVTGGALLARPEPEVGDALVYAYTSVDGRPLEECRLSEWARARLPYFMVPTRWLHVSPAAAGASSQEDGADLAAWASEHLASGSMTEPR